jgi:hypothetical protein
VARDGYPDPTSPVRTSRSSGDSLRLPGAETNRAITLQRRSQMATTLSPLRCLCPLYPRFVAALLRGSGRAVAVNDREIEELSLMKFAYRCPD